MLKNYTISPIDSYKKEIALVGCCIHNKTDVERTAITAIKDSTGFIKSIILQTKLSPKETIFLDGKIFLSSGDRLEFSGCDFTWSGNEDAL